MDSWHSPAIPLSIRRPWAVYLAQLLEWFQEALDDADHVRLPGLGNAIAAAAARGPLSLYNELSVSLQAPYCVVSLSELAAYERYRQAHTGVMSHSEICRFWANIPTVAKQAWLPPSHATTCLVLQNTMWVSLLGSLPSTSSAQLSTRHVSVEMQECAEAATTDCLAEWYELEEECAGAVTTDSLAEWYGQEGEAAGVAAVPSGGEQKLPPEPRLPAGWFTALDPSSGRDYYYSRSGRVQWEWPVEPDIGPLAQLQAAHDAYQFAAAASGDPVEHARRLRLAQQTFAAALGTLAPEHRDIPEVAAALAGLRGLLGP